MLTSRDAKEAWCEDATRLIADAQLATACSEIWGNNPLTLRLRSQRDQVDDLHPRSSLSTKSVLQSPRVRPDCWDVLVGSGRKDGAA